MQHKYILLLRSKTLWYLTDLPEQERTNPELLCLEDQRPETFHTFLLNIICANTKAVPARDMNQDQSGFCVGWF